MPIAALALSLAWLYAGTLKGLAIEWLSSADASYGIVLLAVALAVLWRRRTAFARARNARASAWPGLALLLCGLGAYLVGQLGADVFLTRISFVVALTGAIWFVAGGAAVRVLAAPLVFLLMAIPLPALIVNTITLPLQLVASRIGETTLSAAGVAVFRDGNLLELPSTTLEVAEALYSSRIRAAEQLCNERPVGNATHMTILVFARETFDGAYQDRDVQRFFHEGINAQPGGLLVLIGARGDHDDGQQRCDPVKLAERRPAVPMRHIEIEQDQIRRMFDGACNGFNAIMRLLHHEELGFEHGGQAAAHERVVVCDENALA